MNQALEATLERLRLDSIDLFLAEYISPDDDHERLFGNTGVVAELKKWQAAGKIRYVGASCHNRELALKLIGDGRIDLLMHRYNMAHRKSDLQVLPAALEAQIPVLAFTATRWGSLLRGHTEWHNDIPSAVDCYRFCLANPAIKAVLTAPANIADLKQNLAILNDPAIPEEQIRHWRQYGDLIYGDGRDAYETQWL